MKRVFRSAYAIACIAMAITTAINLTYIRHEVELAPRQPDPAHGYLFPFNIGGGVRYVTHVVHVLHEIWTVVAISCIPFLIVGTLFWKAYETGKGRHLGNSPNSSER